MDALQKIGMRYRPQRQLWAAAVLLNTRGLELTLLKNYLDDGGDYHTCYKLCYHDLQARLPQLGQPPCRMACLLLHGIEERCRMATSFAGCFPSPVQPPMYSSTTHTHVCTVTLPCCVVRAVQGALQQQVMEHVLAEGKAVMVEFAQLAPNGPPGVVLKLLSDVDDTVFSSGGSFPAGSDTRYPK